MNVRIRWLTLAAIVFAIGSVPQLQAQTYTILHDFSGGGDGDNPAWGLTMAGPGNFYGTTVFGGRYDEGTVFNLKHTGSGWILRTLYSFQGGGDGAQPTSPPTIGPDGSLYGTTSIGGSGAGTVYKLTPPATICPTVNCPWTETILYFFGFNNRMDGANPSSKLIFDAAGNLYGTTQFDLVHQLGAVFELSPSNGGWTESKLYRFSSEEDGYRPTGNLIFDGAGNLYGTTSYGGPQGAGNVIELSPNGSGWTKSTLFNFDSSDQGALAFGGVVMDSQGNLYGGTAENAAQGAGTAYQLSQSNGQWNYNLLLNFPGPPYGPVSSPTFDAAGNLYMTGEQSGGGQGIVAKFTQLNGMWQSTILHTFTGSDGKYPEGALIVDADGNIYGTTDEGGSNNAGVIFEITP
jgi:uncharacterized repeat protein (TIGR03803 family)